LDRVLAQFSAAETSVNPLPVHFLSVPYPHDENEQHLVLDLVNDPVVTDSEPVEFILSAEFFDSVRTRVAR
jgi:hypothetical protein